MDYLISIFVVFFWSLVFWGIRKLVSGSKSEE